MDAAALVGRDAELARLETLLEGARGREGRVVLVRGEAGIGKSALVDAFVAHAAKTARVHQGWCDPLGTPQPLDPVRDMARGSPAVAAALQQGKRTAVMEALLELLSPPDRPAVLVVEDVHWADEATLDVIGFLGRRVARTRGLLVLTYRDHDVNADHPMRQIIGELPPANIARIALPPLSLEAVAALAADVALAADLAVEPSQLLALTGGNALFVTEVLASESLAVPRSVEDTVLARLSTLSPPGRRLAELVSIHPGGAEWPLLEGLMDTAASDVEDGVRRGLLTVDAGGVRYRHEIQRRVVESSMSADRRRELHQQALAYLGDEGEAARVVHHARAVGDDATLIAFVPRAARAAMAASSRREAITHFRSLVPFLDRMPVDEAAGVAEDWLRMAAQHGYPDDAIAALPRTVALWRQAGAPGAAARAMALGVMVLEKAGRPREADAAAEEAVAVLEGLPPGADLAFALTERARLHLLRSGDEQAEPATALDRAIDLAEAAGDERNVANALTLKGIFLHNAGDSRGLPLIERAHARAAASGDHFEETEALMILAGKTADVRDLRRALDLAERGRATAARYELRPQEAFARVMRAEVLMWTGEWATAEEEASELLGGGADVEPTAARILATIAMRQRGSAAAAAVRHAWALARQWDQLRLLDPAAGVVAEFLWLADEEDPDWIAELDEVLERGSRSGARWPSGAFAFWMWKLGRLAGVPASVLDWYGWTMRGHPQRAADFWAAQGAGYDQAMALLHGDDARAVEALRILEDLGADGAARRVRRELQKRGIRAPRGSSRATRRHPAGLTARQAEVMELLAAGLSNAEIADRLFVSPRTAENHVTAILHKLDAGTRQSAVRKARELGLLDGGRLHS